MPANAWNVYRSGKCIDTVFFDTDCDKAYVLRALIEHDGYHASITVRRARKYAHAFYPPVQTRKVWVP